MDALGELLVRVTVMYGAALLALRLSGKRGLHHLSALDFLIVLLIGDLFDDAFWGDVAMAQALTALFALAGAHILATLAAAHSTLIERWVCGGPTALVRDGLVQEAGLRRERLGRRTFGELLRLRGYDRGEEHELARFDLEPGGQVSLRPRSQAMELRRRDVSSGGSDTP